MFLLSCVCDSITAKLCEGCRCVTEIHEAGTNVQDIWIVGIICFTVVLLALIAKCAVLSWKNADINAAEGEQAAKESDADVAKRKQDSDLLNKKLEILKELCYEIKEVPVEKCSKEEKIKDIKIQKKLRSLNSDEVREYLKALGYLIDKNVSDKTENHEAQGS